MAYWFYLLRISRICGVPRVSRKPLIPSEGTFTLPAPPAAEIALMHAGLNCISAATLLDPSLLNNCYRVNVHARRVREVAGAYRDDCGRRTGWSQDHCLTRR